MLPFFTYKNNNKPEGESEQIHFCMNMDQELKTIIVFRIVTLEVVERP